MYIKSIANLIYTANGKLSNGSPTILEKRIENVLVDEAETFSNQYYTDSQREMRLSRNIIIPVHLVSDQIQAGVRYELTYIEYDSLKYKVRNILKVKGTRMKMLLDVQELR